MEHFMVRTDLALEAREEIEGRDQQVNGILVDEYDKNGTHITQVEIATKNAARLMGRPVGQYITIEAPNLDEEDEGYHREISECVAVELMKLLPKQKDATLLVVGLGNRQVTADALGPQTLDNLQITRHMVQEFGAAAYDCRHMMSLCAIEPGVMAKTGMETAEIVTGVVREIHPDAVLVIDALAARSVKRLNRTIQIANTGIQPGSGVGNHRQALNEETLGVPVLALGIPTVVDSKTIVLDAMEKSLEREQRTQLLQYFEKKQTLFSELNNMYMTGKDVDFVIKRISFTISEAINMALTARMEKM